MEGSRGGAGEPSLSVVVVVHDMARELPRTLETLSPARQLGVTVDDYEVIVVDNGSAAPVEPATTDAAFGAPVRVERLDPAPKSPAAAANLGLGLASGDVVGLIVDGARMASPGLLAGVRRAVALADQPVITAPAFHLGEVPHMRAAEVGYDQCTEDALLDTVDWTSDGYELFTIATPAGSSGRGLFGPMGESSSLFARRATWDRLGGLDERFDLPGGGLVNHDLYRRACDLEGTELVVLLGEGTFHQFHGGAATSGRHGWDEMHAQYEQLVGRPHCPPPQAPLYVGRVPRAALGYVERSARQAASRSATAGW